MTPHKKLLRIFLGVPVLLILVSSSGCAMYDRMMGAPVELSGANEVPPVRTNASGTGYFRVKDDRSISGKVTVTGMKPAAAHVHFGSAKQNGPVVLPLKKVGENSYQVPDGSRLSERHYRAYRAGHLYVNVHSATHKGGEVRAQLVP